MDPIRLILALLNVFSLLIMIRVGLSWFNPNPRHELLLWVIRLTEPILAPLRSLIPIPGWDLSPIVAWLLIRLLMKLIIQAGA